MIVIGELQSDYEKKYSSVINKSTCSIATTAASDTTRELLKD
jgi:hypothetical protein